MNQHPVFSRDEFLERIRRVEQALEAERLDALIAYSVKNAPGPVNYLAGYESTLGLHDVSFFLLAPHGSPRYALLANSFWDNLGERTWVDDLFVTGEFGETLSQLLPHSARRVGIAGLNFFPAPIWATLRASFPAVEFCDATGLLMQAARRKSAAEIEVLRRCAEMTDAGGRAFLANAQPGKTERELKAEVERAIMLAGSDALYYGFQISSGPAAARGMGQMTGRTLRAGEQVQVDCGALHYGYHGDFSRITVVGSAPSGPVRDLMEITAEMYEAMLGALQPGVPTAAIARVAIDVAREHGMEEYLFRSPNQAIRLMGHGTGCWYLEAPEIHPAAHGLIESDMVIVLEPILAQPGVGGAKIEDMVLVTDTGAERLSKIPLRTWSQ